MDVITEIQIVISYIICYWKKLAHYCNTLLMSNNGHIYF